MYKKAISLISFSAFSLLGELSPKTAAAAAKATECNVSTSGTDKGEITPCTPSAIFTVKSLIFKVIDWVLGFGAAIAILFIIYAGFQYMTAAGNEKQAASAKQTLTYAIIGLIVILLAYVIVAFVGTATQDLLNQTVIN